METREFPVAVIASIATGVAFCKFSDLHEAAEYLMGRPIWTHQFASKELWQAMQRAVLEQCPDLSAKAAEPGATVTIRKGGGCKQY